MEEKVIKQGFMTKQGGRWKSWKKRWFVLRGKIIFYYKNPKKRSPIGMLPITQASKVYVSQAKTKKKFCFNLEIPGQRTYLISAPSEEEMNSWIEIINQIIKSELHDKVSMKDFKKIRVVGRGTFGKVYLVQKLSNQEYYAMKSLQKGKIAECEQIEQTMAERNVLMRTKHPFLVSLHFSFQTEERLFMILDFIDGGELFFHLKNEGRFDEERVILYSAEIVLALEHLHKMDIVYRDLKPENILIGSDGHIRLTDFGLVKMNISKKKDGKTSTFCGTPEYLAPEILKDEGYGKAVDWWSLGILIYEMLVGLPPFYSENLNVMYQKILTAPLKFPPGLSLSVRGLISELLNRDPAKRLGSGGDDSSPIKKHKFFEKLDWEKVFNKEMTPTFKPEVKNPTDTRFFDREFTEENLAESVPEISFMGRDSNAFKGFTFEEEVEGIGNVKNF
ncbi:non-specific serine/threonine protein kinase [Anaeramoeba ignava]|uniref:non-specific serine/threonine protein kinase n=1 Tax=Anaeramoeba ignava TaxID=1746090 RepID=A0A9Q0RH40_ANAIG|nr:non-specific serine/threonine protein kinase [Anaeramoeba ignava]|eukprot:Anaeramoba_ignava/c20957_g1_i1.p1 GENE.c20957_g1_i1~~c20957_g1_i1.p1  ORF type:complete len:447 (-),score=142.16 c20957_g1_i1:154-1494(-)